MHKYTCKTHGISILIDGNKRTFETPPGSYAGVPKCHLLLMPQPAEGKFINLLTPPDCEIVKE